MGEGGKRVTLSRLLLATFMIAGDREGTERRKYYMEWLDTSFGGKKST